MDEYVVVLDCGHKLPLADFFLWHDHDDSRPIMYCAEPGCKYFAEVRGIEKVEKGS